MEQVSEAERIVRLLLFIRENAPVSYAQIRQSLPNEYGIEAGTDESIRRRFERDKVTLAENGIFLTLDDNQQYSLDSKRTIAAPINLTPPQMSLLRIMCGALLEDDDYPFKEELRMVLVKLGNELELPDMLPQIEKGSSGKSSRSNTVHGLQKIKKAISSRKRLDFQYTNSSGTLSQRRVEPVGCFFLGGLCYVVAHDPEVHDNRCFRLDRMSRLRVNASSPGTPDFDERPFSASDYQGLPFQFGDECEDAVIRLDGAAATRAGKLFGRNGMLVESDGALLWKGVCRDSKTLARWCIENGPGLEIIEPTRARDALMDGVASFVEKLEQGESHER